MKTHILLSIVALSSTLHADFIPLIRQTTTFEDGRAMSVKFIENVEGLSGSVSATEYIDKSALFELFSIDDSQYVSGETENATDFDDIVTEHDEESSASYLPTADINIIAVDCSNGVAKTRVLSPFSVQIEVGGLVTDDPDAQDAAKWVNVYHTLTEYATDSFEVDGNETTTAPDDPAEIDSNGTTLFYEEVITQIPSSNLFSLRGEETITVYAQPDFGFETPTQLGSDKIIICPMTSGSLELTDTLNSNGFYASIPDVTVIVTDMYPGHNDYGNTSSCDVLVYSGNAVSNPEDLYSASNSTELDEAKVHSWITTTELEPKSVDTTVALSDLRRNATIGTYTVDLIQHTVHGTERLSSVTFVYDPTIKVNANIGSAE